MTVLRLEQIRRDLVIAWSGLPPDDLELLQSLRHVIARRRGFHVAVDVQDAAIDADIEGVTSGIAALQDAVGSSGLLARVAQDRVVQAERLGELTIGLGIVDACREVGDVERPDPLAARTERRAFGRSATGERLREPGKDDRLLSHEVGEPVGLPVRAGKGERGRQIAHTWLLRSRAGGGCGEAKRDERHPRHLHM